MANLIKPPAGHCGDPYKIFFEQPAPDLPATAQFFDGSTSWVAPPIATPAISNLAFIPDNSTSLVKDGTISFDVANFTGQADVLVDVDNNGSYTDAVDRSLPAFAANGSGTVAFDGLDGTGTPVDPTTTMHVKVSIDHVGEIHLVSEDVEARTGIDVSILNGPSPGSVPVYWDDTHLVAAGRSCVTSPVDGTAGIADGGSGVHGWSCNENSNNGVNGSWGDARDLDDWTYVPTAFESDIAVPDDALLPTPLVDPYVGIVALSVIVMAGLGVAYTRRRRSSTYVT
jgi:hypothetical protein